MIGASAGELLDLVAQMEEFQIAPNTASFNLVLKAMYQANETVAAEKLIERLEFCVGSLELKLLLLGVVVL